MPLWMTPLLRPVWWRAGPASLSITVTDAFGAWPSSAYAVARPTIPAPTTVTSERLVVVICVRLLGARGVWMRGVTAGTCGASDAGQTGWGPADTALVG